MKSKDDILFGQISEIIKEGKPVFEEDSWDEIQKGYQLRQKARKNRYLWFLTLFILITSMSLLSVIKSSKPEVEEKVLNDTYNTTINSANKFDSNSELIDISIQSLDENQKALIQSHLSIHIKDQYISENRGTIVGNVIRDNIDFKKFHCNQNFEILFDSILNKEPKKVNTIFQDTGFSLYDNLLLKWGQKNGFYFKLNFSKSITGQFNSFDQNALPQIHEDFTMIQKESEKLGLSFSGGFNLVYKFNNTYSIQSGLFITQHRIGGAYHFENNKIPVRDSASNEIIGYLKRDKPILVNEKIKRESNYLEVPFIIGVDKNISNKFSVSYKLGGNYFYNLNSSGNYLNYNNLEIDNLSQQLLRENLFGVYCSFGAYYQVSDKYVFGIEPYYKQFITSGFEDASLLSIKPYYVGINTNLLFKMKN